MLRKALLFTLLTACATAPPAARPPQPLPSALRQIPAAWLSVPPSQRFATISYGPDGILRHVAAPRDQGPIRLERTAQGDRLMNGDKPLTPWMRQIDSFDHSAEREEVAFSALRTSDFEIGLVNTAGGDIVWVPADPTDEIAVQWAPRGNKISYILRGRSGDYVRTLHIPTSYQFTVGFPQARITALAWEPKAERYAATWSSPNASARVEQLNYEGTERRIIVPPEVRLDVQVEPVVEGAFALRPSTLRYNEKLPLVIWPAPPELHTWNDALGNLLRNRRVGAVVAAGAHDAAFWKAVGELAWVDRGRVFVVAGRGAAPEGFSVTAIDIDPAAAGSSYVVERNVVRVPAAVVESFAAGYIADQLKGTSPPNGSSR